MERKVFQPEIDWNDLHNSDDWRFPDDLEAYELYHQQEQFQAEIWRLEDLIEEKEKKIDELIQDKLALEVEIDAIQEVVKRNLTDCIKRVC